MGRPEVLVRMGRYAGVGVGVGMGVGVWPCLCPWDGRCGSGGGSLTAFMCVAEKSSIGKPVTAAHSPPTHLTGSE